MSQRWGCRRCQAADDCIFKNLDNRENGVTIIVTSHDMDDLEEMAERILMISAGKIAYDGDFDGLRALTGRPSRLRLTVDSVCPPDLPIGHLLSEGKGRLRI